MARLKLFRAPDRFNENEEMTIYINESQLGSLKNDEHKFFSVPEGQHNLHIKLSGVSGTKKHSFKIKEEETKGFVIHGNGKAKSFEPFVSGLWIFDFIVNGLIMLYLFTTGANQFIKIKKLEKH